MRLSSILLTVTTALLMTASNAQAVNFFLTVTSGELTAGSDVTLDLSMDTEGDDVQAWFLDVFHTDNTSTDATQPQFLFLNGQLFSPLGVPAAGADSTGQYAIAQSGGGGTGTTPITTLIGTLALDNLVEGTIDVDVAAQGGAVGGPGGVDLVAAGLVTFDSITVPEPGFAIMGFFSLATLGLIRRHTRLS